MQLCCDLSCAFKLTIEYLIKPMKTWLKVWKSSVSVATLMQVNLLWGVWVLTVVNGPLSETRAFCFDAAYGHMESTSDDT